MPFNHLNNIKFTQSIVYHFEYFENENIDKPFNWLPKYSSLLTTKKLTNLYVINIYLF